MTALDAANAAPPASDTERKSALGWIAAVVVLGVIALIIAGVYSYKSHKAEVATIVNKPVALPELVKPTIFKRIAKKIAPQAVNTPATSKSQEQIDFESDVKLFNQLNKDKAVIVPKKAKKPLSPEDAAFEKELDDLEAQFKKDEL